MTASPSGEARFGCPTCLSVFRTGFARCPIDGAILQQVDRDPLVGVTIGERYLIEDCIGEGAMGRVYRARHERLSRRFAVKVLFGELASDDKMRDRFAREAEAASRLSHPNVVAVVDFGTTPAGLLYLVMDFIEGIELADMLLEEAPLSADRTRSIAIALCDGLGHAHANGLVHRDFKAENVIMAGTGESKVPKIVDFGIVVLVEEMDRRLTTEGLIIGTPAYMSPEQATGQEVDARSDLYSLGVLIYEMLAGILPFDGDAMTMARQHVAATPPRFSTRVPGLLVDAELEAVVRKLLEKKPDDRYQTAAELRAALEESQTRASDAAASTTTVLPSEDAQPEARSSAAFLLGTLAILVALGTGAYFSLKSGPAPSSAEVGPDAGGLEVGPPAVADTAGQELAQPAFADASVEGAAAHSVDDASVRVAVADPATDAKNAEPPGSVPRHATTGVNRRDHESPVPTPVELDAAVPAAGSDTVDASGTSDARTRIAPKTERSEVTVKSLTALYISVGESIEKLAATDPGQAERLRSEYAAIPFNDALRVPELRRETQARLKKIRRKLP